MKSGRVIWNEPVLPIADLLAQERRRRHHGGWILTLVLLLLAGTGITLHARMAERRVWDVDGVEFTGNRAVAAEDLARALDLHDGMPWWRAARRLGTHTPPDVPRALRVRVRHAFPNGLRVDVEERVAALRLIGEDRLVVAGDGTLLISDPGVDVVDLPCLSGRFAAARAGGTIDLLGGGDWWSQLMQISTSMPELWSAISQIDCESGRSIQVYLRDGKHVVLWDPHRNAHLWGQVPLVLDQLQADGLADDAVLDMRFRDRIVVRVPGQLDEDESEANGKGEDLGSSHPGGRRA